MEVCMASMMDACQLCYHYMQYVSQMIGRTSVRNEISVTIYKKEQKEKQQKKLLPYIYMNITTKSGFGCHSFLR